MKFENTWVGDFENAIIGMRNPFNSWDKSDSAWEWVEDPSPINPDDPGMQYVIGPKDLDLAQRLLSSGSASDCKFMRMIPVSVQITCPAYFAQELDTYKVGTVRNSCSLQHKGSSRDFTLQDFTFDDVSVNDWFDSNYDTLLQTLLEAVNAFRKMYKDTKDYRYFRIMRQLVPMGYNYTFMWAANYEVLRNIYFQRRNHLLKEWNTDFMNWIKTLPYAEELIMYEVQDDER